MFILPSSFHSLSVVIAKYSFLSLDHIRGYLAWSGSPSAPNDWVSAVLNQNPYVCCWWSLTALWVKSKTPPLSLVKIEFWPVFWNTLSGWDTQSTPWWTPSFPFPVISLYGSSGSSNVQCPIRFGSSLILIPLLVY